MTRAMGGEEATQDEGASRRGSCICKSRGQSVEKEKEKREKDVPPLALLHCNVMRKWACSVRLCNHPECAETSKRGDT